MNTARIALRAGGARRLLPLVILLTILMLLGPASGNRWTRVRIAQAQQNDQAFEDEMLKGRELVRRHQYEEALKSFKRANEMRERKSPECFLEMAQAYQALEAYKNVVDSCDRVIELAVNNTRQQAQAYNLKGIALQSQALGKDQKKLHEAEAVFRQGLALEGEQPVIHYNLGVVLLQLGRDPEGLAEVGKYLELQPHGANADAARKMVENPRRARENFAPDFSLTTADGEYIALDDLRGKVVLLDFWGTWCPPCVASVPSLRALHKKYEKETSFVMISISTDGEAEKWQTFTAKNQMSWPQYLDRQRKVVRAFDVRAYPTYIVLDHEGIVRFRNTGFSSERDGGLEDIIRKQLKIVAKATTPN